MPEEDLNAMDAGEAGDDGGAGAKKKSGPLPEFLILILKIVAAAVGAIILSATVSLIVFNISQGDKQGQGQIPDVSANYVAKPPVLDAFASIPEIRSQTKDKRMVVLKVHLECDYKKYVQLFGEITGRESKIHDLIRSYISQKTAHEMEEEERVKEELKRKINDLLYTGRIEEVLFANFFITEGL